MINNYLSKYDKRLDLVKINLYKHIIIYVQVYIKYFIRIVHYDLRRFKYLKIEFFACLTLNNRLKKCGNPECSWNLTVRI